MYDILNLVKILWKILFVFKFYSSSLLFFLWE